METYTAAKARKRIEFLEDEKRRLLEFESDRYVYSEEDGRREERVPDYSYARTRSKVGELNCKLGALRHALHAHEVEAVLPEAGMSLDEAHMRLSFMGEEKRRLASLRDVPDKQVLSGDWRFAATGGECEFANFDVKAAERDYLRICEDISALELEVGLVESTAVFEADA